MRILPGIDAEAEFLVRGEAPPGADAELVELAALARELRASCARPPAEDVAERQLAAIVAEAEAVSAGSAVAVGRDRGRAATRITPARRGRTLGFRLAAAGLATLLAVTGLAIAGVKPPGPLNEALERIGIGGTEEAAKPAGDAGRDASDASKDGDVRRDRAARRDRARARGTDRAGGGNQARGGGEAASQGQPGAPARGEQSRSEAGTINSAPGRATAEEARSGRTPPQSPGRSGDHAPEGKGPPASPGSQADDVRRGGPRPGGPKDAGQRITEEARGHGAPLP